MMPAFSTHYIFALEMMEYIKSTADFEVNPDAVFFGSQGPDIFFFHRVMPWMLGKSLRAYGSALHRTKPEIIFEEMRNYCNKSDNSDIAKSYTYGFILHYALDCTCHPYIYYVQNKIREKSPLTNPHTAHNIVEYAMDSYLLNKRMRIDKPASFDTSELISDNDSLIDEIGSLIAYVLPKCIHKSISKEDCKTALRDIKYIQKLCLDRSFLKHILVYPIELIAAPFSKNFKFSVMFRPRDLEKIKKYANINNGIWESPYTNGKRNESFEELFELAKARAQQLISGFQSGADCKELTKSLSFLTGVEIE